MRGSRAEHSAEMRRRRNIAGAVALTVCTLSVLALLKAHQMGLARAQAITAPTSTPETTPEAGDPR